MTCIGKEYLTTYRTVLLDRFRERRSVIAAAVMCRVSLKHVKGTI